MALRYALSTAVIFCAAAPAWGQSFTETFDTGNEGDWTYGNPQVGIEPAGGNPGAFLSSGQFLDTFAPRLRTQATTSAFTGDYRAGNVTSVGVDLIQLSSFTTTGGRPCTLMLIYNNGTPGNPLDDTAAFFLGANIPAFSDGWVSYDFEVPSESTTLPAGWQLLNLGDSGAPANHDWDTVIQNVDQVQFFYGNPKFIFIFQQWEVGADNLSITMEQTIPTVSEWGLIVMGLIMLSSGVLVLKKRASMRTAIS